MLEKILIFLRNFQKVVFAMNTFIDNCKLSTKQLIMSNLILKTYK